MGDNMANKTFEVETKDGLWGTIKNMEYQYSFRKTFGKQLFIAKIFRGGHYVIVGVYHDENTDSFLEVIEPDLIEIQNIIERSLIDNVDYLTEYIHGYVECIRDYLKVARGYAEELMVSLYRR